MMNAPIESLLEEYLAGSLGPEDRRRFEAHMAAKPEFAREVVAMQELSTLFATLRPEQEVEASSRFYAGVMDKIEAQSRTVSSWWSSLLEPMFASRLVYATLTLLVVLGTAWIVLPEGGPDADAATVARTLEDPSAIMSSGVQPVGFEVKEENPDLLLVNLASYQESGGASGVEYQ